MRFTAFAVLILASAMACASRGVTPDATVVDDHAAPAADPAGAASLVRLAQAGRFDDLRVALADTSAPSVSERGEHGRTALMYATATGDASLVQALLLRGADPNARDDSGNTALFSFPDSDEPEVHRALLAAGADPNARNLAGATPLTTAAALGYARIAAALLDAGADARVRDSRERSALVEALLGGHVTVAEQVLRTGVPLAEELEQSPEPVLERAASSGRTLVVRLLLERLAPRRCGPREIAALTAAIRAGRRDVVDAWLELAPLCDVTLGTEGLTPLQLAAREGRAELIPRLVTAGASLESPGGEPDARSPLLLAAAGGHHAAAVALLDAGAGVDAASRTGVTALMYAAYRGSTSLVGELLRRGATVDATNRDGHTALAFAVVLRHPEVCAALLEAGANPAVEASVDAFGRVTLLALAAGRGHDDIARLLLRAGAPVDTASFVRGIGLATPLLLAARRGNIDLARELITAGADPTRRAGDGRSALEILPALACEPGGPCDPPHAVEGSSPSDLPGS